MCSGIFNISCPICDILIAFKYLMAVIEKADHMFTHGAHKTYSLTHKERLNLRSQNTQPYAQGTHRFAFIDHIALRTRNAQIYVHRTHIITHKERIYIRSQNTHPYAQGTPRFMFIEHISLRTRNDQIEHMVFHSQII